jgi:hypothetical protein
MIVRFLGRRTKRSLNALASDNDNEDDIDERAKRNESAISLAATNHDRRALARIFFFFLLSFSYLLETKHAIVRAVDGGVGSYLSTHLLRFAPSRARTRRGVT